MAEHIEHIEHDNGIHEIIFLDASRHAVDEYMNTLEELVTPIVENNSVTKLFFIANLTQSHDLPSFSYITRQGRKLLHEHLSDRDKFHLRGAFLAKHDEVLVLSLAESFIKLMPVDMIMKVFEEESRDEAINWLLADE